MTRQDAMQMAGYLYKKSSAGEWQRRYFETNGNYLTYYKSHKMTKLLAAVAMPQVGIIKMVGSVNDAKGSGHIFQLDLRDRQYLLRATSQEEAQQWVDYLLMLRDGSFGPAGPSNPMNYQIQVSSFNVQQDSAAAHLEPRATIQKSSRIFSCCR